LTKTRIAQKLVCVYNLSKFEIIRALFGKNAKKLKLILSNKPRACVPNFYGTDFYGNFQKWSSDRIFARDTGKVKAEIKLISYSQREVHLFESLLQRKASSTGKKFQFNEFEKFRYEEIFSQVHFVLFKKSSCCHPVISKII
jgi:hypothetical protein